MRVVELPLGVTEDRLVGTLDIEHALKKGEKRFEPGLLAAANRNFLYVDEVNLLEDHIVDLLLDSAAMGVNTVEREGISFTHPARFILVGTMNPEEGELRPQLLDRFGLCVRVSLRARQSVEGRDIAAQGRLRPRPGQIHEELAGRAGAPGRQHHRRRGRGLPACRSPDPVLEQDGVDDDAALLDGHRADIVILKAARALAASGTRGTSGQTRSGRRPCSPWPTARGAFPSKR